MSNGTPLTISPDLQTRESVQLAAGRVQFAVTGPDGMTRYVRFDAKLKGPNGYKKVPLEEASHVFITEKGYGTPQIGTYYPQKGIFYGRAEGESHVEAMQVVIDHVNGVGLPTGWTVKAESRCGICMQRLTDPVSIQRGIGPECASKPTGTKILHASAFHEQLTTDSIIAEGIQIATEMVKPDSLHDHDATKVKDAEWAMQRLEYLRERRAEAEKHIRDINCEIAELEVPPVALPA